MYKTSFPLVFQLGLQGKGAVPGWMCGEIFHRAVPSFEVVKSSPEIISMLILSVN